MRVSIPLWFIQEQSSVDRPRTWPRPPKGSKTRSWRGAFQDDKLSWFWSNSLPQSQWTRSSSCSLLLTNHQPRTTHIGSWHTTMVLTQHDYRDFDTLEEAVSIPLWFSRNLVVLTPETGGGVLFPYHYGSYATNEYDSWVLNTNKVSIPLWFIQEPSSVDRPRTWTRPSKGSKIRSWTGAFQDDKLSWFWSYCYNLLLEDRSGSSFLLLTNHQPRTTHNGS